MDEDKRTAIEGILLMAMHLQTSEKGGGDELKIASAALQLLGVTQEEIVEAGDRVFKQETNMH